VDNASDMRQRASLWRLVVSTLLLALGLAVFRGTPQGETVGAVVSLVLIALGGAVAWWRRKRSPWHIGYSVAAAALALLVIVLYLIGLSE
jgi:hypothetical protein